MEYDVNITADAEKDLNQFISYLIITKKSPQAATNVLNDFEATVQSLKHVAKNLKLCENPKLREIGYRRINFLSHRYFLLYRIEEKIVFIDRVFHELQDYENKMS